MRRALFALMLALAGCGVTPTSEVSEPPARVLAGSLNAASANARAVTGGLTIQRAGLMFSNGIAVYTRTLAPRRGGDVITSSGDSYAAAALGPSDLLIELRHVIEQSVPDGLVGLCGAEQPAYVALAYDERAASVTMLVFSGAEAPGPEATQSRLCARYAYAAPDGARTREGVVL